MAFIATADIAMMLVAMLIFFGIIICIIIIIVLLGMRFTAVAIRIATARRVVRFPLHNRGILRFDWTSRYGKEKKKKKRRENVRMKKGKKKSKEVLTHPFHSKSHKAEHGLSHRAPRTRRL